MEAAMFLRRVALLLGLLAVVSACGAAASGQGVDPPATAAVGGLPPATPTTAPEPTTTTSTAVVRTTVTLPLDAKVGARVAGNRVLLIGDSVMASTSQRYGGEMCDALVALGWQAEVDAESGRFVDFGDRVLDERLAAGWDAAVILLGNNYGEDQPTYRRYLEAMVMRLSPQPVVLLTVTEFKPSRAEVNAVIFEMAQKYPNVVVLDWAVVSAADPSITGADGLHLTDPGRSVLAQQVAEVLGTAPTQPGKCLASSFRDDSSATETATPTTVKKSTKTTTTVARATTTPVTDPAATDPAGTDPGTSGSSPGTG
ncbi:MAG TPA: hypothetical protein DCQ52_05770 [Acidimicrobiaceae bacterium]|jgi:hypothetical protein|nr:hypothetical protein [Acidimicrobiaceae bacterium]